MGRVREAHPTGAADAQTHRHQGRRRGPAVRPGRPRRHRRPALGATPSPCTTPRCPAGTWNSAPPPAAGTELVDLGSGNGTLVNGQPVQAAPLRSGDHDHARPDGPDVHRRRGTTPAADELTEPRPAARRGRDQDVASAIVRTVGADAGSQILARPDDGRDRLAPHPARQPRRPVRDRRGRQPHPRRGPAARPVMDLVLKSVDADHGCFMLRDDGPASSMPEGRPLPRRGCSRQEELAVSRTIVDHVLKEKQGVLVSDAAPTTGSAAARASHRHNIREVICVPMKGRRETLGVLFLDTQSHAQAARRRRPEPASSPRTTCTWPVAIAHQAALAVEETPLPPGAGQRRAAGGRRPDDRGPVAPHQEHHAGRPVRRRHGPHGPRRRTTRTCSARAGSWSRRTRAGSTS